MLDLNAADALAALAHEGQTRLHGAPYLEHPRAVRRFTEHLSDAVGFALDDGARAVALLHDVLEDSSFTREQLADRFGDDVARRVALLSKPPLGVGDDKATHASRYFRGLDEKADDVTRLVKVADRLHNLSELPLTKDPARQRRYLEETAVALLPLARNAHDTALGRGLVGALQDGIDVCARLCGLDHAAARDLDDGGAVPQGAYVIVDVHASSSIDGILALVDAAAAGGAALLQVRGKGVTDRRLLAVVEGALPSCKAARVPLLVNDRADIAVLVGADGVHVGQHDLPPALVRRLLPVSGLLGASSHTLAQASAAIASDVLDYVAFGPVFSSPTKRGHADVTGLAALLEVTKSAPLPVCAIGGITSPARMADVARAGAQLGAVISAVASAPDPFEATRALGIAHAAARAQPVLVQTPTERP